MQDEVEENKEYEDMEVTEEYDVIVFGAEPEGIAGAVSAARNGLKVLLVEKRDGPGGLMTYGLLNTIALKNFMKRKKIKMLLRCKKLKKLLKN